MDIKQLQYFVVSVDMGSFHAAAKVLFTTQSHISKTIKSLETELDMELFERKSNGVLITDEGQKIYQYAVGVLKDIQNMTNLKEKQEWNHFSIATTPSNIMASLVAEYYNQIKNTTLQIDFWEGSVEDVMTRVHRRNSEIGFVYISERHLSAFQCQAHSKGLFFQELKRTKFYLYVGKNHPLYGAEEIEESMIGKMKLIRNYEEHYSLINHLGHIQEEPPLKNKALLMSTNTNSDHFMMHMLRSTDYSYLGGDVYKYNLEENGIRAIPVTIGNQSIFFGYFKRVKDELGPIPTGFLNFLQQKIQ